MSTKVHIRFWIKETVLTLLLAIDSWFFNAQLWLERHAPEAGDLFCHLRWAFEQRVFSPMFAWAYSGSIREIEDAFEFSFDEMQYGCRHDWLTPFQRKVAEGRILPL